MFSVLVAQYHCGCLVSVWFVAPGVYVYASHVGYYVANYFELPGGYWPLPF